MAARRAAELPSVAPSWLRRVRLSRAVPEGLAALRCSSARTSDCTTAWKACLPAAVANCVVHAGVSTSTKSLPASLVQPSVKLLAGGLLLPGSVACAAPAIIDATRLSTAGAFALDLATGMVGRLGGFMVGVGLTSPILRSSGCASGRVNDGLRISCKPPNDETPCRGGHGAVDV